MSHAIAPLCDRCLACGRLAFHPASGCLLAAVLSLSKRRSEIMKKRLWVLGILLSMTVACQSHPMEKEATPAGSRLAPPTVRHTPTFPPLETNTPNPTGAIPSTLTPRSTSFAPRQVGGPNTGFSITVPGTWIQTGDLLNATQRETLGMQRLFFADSKNT